MQRLDRRNAVAQLLHERGDLLVVAGLGSPAYDLASTGNRGTDFPTWGAMGGALMMGLGLALSQPERNILVLTGDGEMLMGMGSLATVASQQPKNLRLVILDNEQYGETGHQPTHTGARTDLAAVAQACGIDKTAVVTDEQELAVLRSEIHTYEGPLVAVLKVSAEAVPRVLPPIDGPFLTHRMRATLLGEEGALQA